MCTSVCEELNSNNSTISLYISSKYINIHIMRTVFKEYIYILYIYIGLKKKNENAPHN